jgi:hypothetical protein
VQQHVPPVIEMPLQSPGLLHDASLSHSIPEVSYAEIDVTELDEPQSRRLLWVVLVILLAAAAGATAALWTRVPALLMGRTVPTTTDIASPHTDSAPDSNTTAQRNPTGDMAPGAANANPATAAPAAGPNDVVGAVGNDAARTREAANTGAANAPGRDEPRANPTPSETRPHDRPRPHADAPASASGANPNRDSTRPGGSSTQTPGNAPKPHRPRDADPGRANQTGEEMLPNPYYH